MAQFDVYRNPNKESARRFPFLLDIQSGLLDRLATRVVVPLIAVNAGTAGVSTLNPEFELEGRRYVALTQELAGVPARGFGTPIASLAERRHEILAAVDVVVSGV